MVLNILATFNFCYSFLFTLPLLIYFGLWALFGRVFGSKTMVHYGSRCMVGVDQVWNAALRGEEDETVSSRLGRAIKSGRAKWWAKAFAAFVNGFFRIVAGQKNHCLESIEERYLAGAPSDERLSFIKAVA